MIVYNIMKMKKASSRNKKILILEEVNVTYLKK